MYLTLNQRATVLSHEEVLNVLMIFVSMDLRSTSFDSSTFRLPPQYWPDCKKRTLKNIAELVLWRKGFDAVQNPQVSRHVFEMRQDFAVWIRGVLNA